MSGFSYTLADMNMYYLFHNLNNIKYLKGELVLILFLFILISNFYKI